jgi:hypothetical protein
LTHLWIEANAKAKASVSKIPIFMTVFPFGYGSTFQSPKHVLNPLMIVMIAL